MSPLAAPSTCVIVADRAHLGDLASVCEDPALGGGGWSDGARLFAEQDVFLYLVLAACEKRRIARRAPLILLARDEQALRLAISHACEKLDDVTCAWFFFCTGETRAIAEPLIAADARSEGQA